MRETRQERKARLEQTAEGRALLGLIDEYGTSVALAAVAEISALVVSQWIRAGRVSRRGALVLSEKLGRPKGYFRPDLTPDQWEYRHPGRAHGEASLFDSEDARLLLDLAKKHGGTNAFCEKAGISIGQFHTWKSRGRISAIYLPRLHAMTG